MKKILSLILTLLMLISFVACGNSSKETHSHAFGKWETVKNPTCNEDGSKERFCTCGEKQTQAISKTGHTIEVVEAVKETCTTDGSTMSTYCKVCGEIIEKAEVIPACHKYNEPEITKEATCSAEGEAKYTCTVCNEVKTEVIKKIAHSYVSKVTKEATCTANGEKTNTCNVCKEKQTVSISATGHTWKAATCTEPKTCSKCGAKEGSAKGHNLVDNKCTICGEGPSIKLKVPSVPLTLKSYYGKIKITEIRWQTKWDEYDEDYYTAIYGNVEKIAGDAGEFVIWNFTVLDPDGYEVITSSNSVTLGAVGSKKKDVLLASFNHKDLEGTYTLKLYNF